MTAIQWMEIGALKPNKRNARTHSKEQSRQIADSISAFGFVVPIVNDENGNVIAGHSRLAAARLLELKQVPCKSVRGPDADRHDKQLIGLILEGIRFRACSHADLLACSSRLEFLSLLRSFWSPSPHALSAHPDAAKTKLPVCTLCASIAQRIVNACGSAWTGKRADEFLEPVPFRSRPDFGLGVAKSADQR